MKSLQPRQTLSVFHRAERQIRLLVASFVLLSLAACGSELNGTKNSAHSPAAHPDDPARNAFGINTWATLDWARNRPFTDLMKTARPFSTLTDDAVRVPVDDHGWPTTDAATIVFADLSQNHGTYALSFHGRADVEVRGEGTLSEIAYDASSDTSTATLVIANPEAKFLALAFRDTSGGVRDIRLMRPTSPGATESYSPEQVFTDVFLDLVDHFQAIRSMDWVATNSSGQVSWSDRVLPSFASFNRPTEGYGWQGRGAAWETVVSLANEAGKDLWICVPAQATDEYVRELAKLMRDGSTVDGVRYPGLRDDLHLYVEYSNEVWNTHGDFQQTPQNHAAATAEVSAGTSPLAFDGVTDPWILGWRRLGYRAASISVIFRETFGDDEMMTRVRPVLAWQQNDGQATGSTALDFVDRWFGTPRPEVDEAHPVSWFFYGGGGSAYYNPENQSHSLTLESIWTSRTFDLAAWEQVLRGDAMLTLAYGLRRVAYEGGPSLDGNESLEVKRAAIEDPRMTDLIVAHHDAWSRYGGDLLMYYADAGEDAWGFTPDVLDLDTAKLNAMKILAERERPAPTIGTVPPHDFAGGEYDHASASWLPKGGNAVRLEKGKADWVLYVLRLDTPATLAVRVEHAAGTADADLQIRVDGVELGGIAATTDGITPPLPVELGAGLHGIVVRANAGAFDLRRVSITTP